MDEDRPSDHGPMANHPNAVSSMAQDSNLPEDEAITPKAYEPVPPDYHKNKSKKGRYFLVALVVLIAAAAVYWFLLKPKPVKTPDSSTSTGSQTLGTSPLKTDTTHYDSSNFNLSIDYPKDWKLSDVSGSGKLIVTSTPVKIKDTRGQQVDGQIVMTIRDKTQTLSEFGKGAGTAVINSEKISYTKPSETQRGDTYISFVNFASSKDTGLDAIYITGDSGYQKDQDVPAVDISKIDPITNVTFVKCSDSKCSGTGIPLTVATSNWQDPSISVPIKSLLDSLSIQ